MTDTKVKHAEKLGKIEDWNAPWETSAGEIDIDKPRLKKYIYGLALDAAKRADRAEEAEAKVTEAKTATKKAQDELAASDSTGKITQLQQELAKAQTEGSTASLKLLKITVGAEAGLTVKQSLRLQGETEDELKDDAKELVDTFGAAKQETDEEREEREEREEEEAEEGLNRTPTRLTNPADSRRNDGGNDGGPASEADFLKAVEGIGNRNFI